MNTIIRIISFQNAQNFGAVLQAYGLQQVLKNWGYKDVAFINYNPQYLSCRYLVFPYRWYLPSKNGFHELISFYVNLPFILINRWRRNHCFNKSRKRLLIQTSKQYHSIEELVGESCNILILGSDQIWSTWITGTPDPVFFGKGEYIGLKRIVSYAPSTELSSFDDKSTVDTIGDYLQKIDYLSVREESVKEKLHAIYGLDAQVCVDPTILCGRDIFDVISKKRLIKKDYILVYSYDNGSKLIQDIIHSIPNYINLEIHYISFGCSGLRESISRNNHNEIDVEDFVSLFKYASYVVTNSFHGLVFSLLYNCKFAVAYEEGKSARCESLLSLVGCKDRMINSNNVDAVKWDSFDFEGVNKRIELLRSQSCSFLRGSIKAI